MLRKLIGDKLIPDILLDILRNNHITEDVSLYSS
jgi:hypothetical protein